MASKTHVYEVEMTCEGCSGAVQRVLNKLQGKGVENIDINLPEKIVKVTTTLNAEAILDVIKKTGKSAKFLTTL